MNGVSHTGERFTLDEGYLAVGTHPLNVRPITRLPLRFHRAFAGALFNPASAEVLSLDFTCYGLAEWLGQELLAFEDDGTSRARTVRLTIPPPTEVRLDDFMLAIKWSISENQSARDGSRAVIGATPWFSITYNVTQPMHSVGWETRVLRDFLSLMLGAATTIRHEQLCFSNIEAPVHCYAKYFEPPRMFRQAVQHGALIPFSRVSDRLTVLWQKWFHVYKQLHGALIPYFAAQYQPAPFAESRCFDFASVAEAVCRGLLLDSKALSYVDCVQRLVNRFPSLAEDAIGDADNIGQICQLVRRFRVTDAHKLSESVEALDGWNLNCLAAKLKMFIDAWLLAELGLSEDEIDCAIRGNRHYWGLASAKLELTNDESTPSKKLDES